MPNNSSISSDNDSKQNAYQIQSDNRYRRRRTRRTTTPVVQTTTTTRPKTEHESNQELTNAFIEKLTAGVLAKNRTQVNDCFDLNFKFESCKRTDNKIEMVGEMLEQTGSNFQMIFDASYDQPVGHWLKIMGKFNGWKGHTYNIYFSIIRENLKAVRGEVLRCSPGDP
ncbi:hypothetical protein GCK72_022732 [Caenorhabditis remanei]|uniref:NTF2-like domain-containing protein n=1 Tax=Caenorhabditis remanei TaxID=31234 RepID=A0A6A5FUY8_CAERE|nr:hypothetical protein GCK72_022732 [Caenorhabditis remanei]KAF1746279.1 hypothetical protein GCK72_022732 [Caenorhabditis remanei]